MQVLPNKLPIFIILLFICFNGTAQQVSEESFVWELDFGSSREVYLVGLLPISRENPADISPKVEQILAEAEIVVFDKSPLDLKAEYQRLFTEKGFYRPDEMLEDHLSPELFRQLEKRLEELNSPLGHMPRMKPWLITISLLNLEIEEAGFSRTTLKDFYFDRATKEDKEIFLLNDVPSEQNLLSNLSADTQVKYLRHCLKNSKNNIAFNSRLYDVCQKGDFKKFSSLIQKQQQMLPASIQEIQHKIQQSIEVDEIIEIINTNKNAVIFVDAAQLVGKNGLLNKLAAEGIEISEL